MTKIKMCYIPEDNRNWDYNVLNDTEPYTIKVKQPDNTIKRITKPAKEWTRKQRPYLKSEITTSIINGYEKRRKEVLANFQKPTTLNGRKIKKVTKHCITYEDGALDIIEFPCLDDIKKIKAKLGL